MRKIPATAATRAAWSFGRTSSPRLKNLAERGQIFGVGIEVFVHRREFPVQPSNDRGLQIFRMQLANGICVCQPIKGSVDHVASKLRLAWNHQLPLTREQDEPSHIEHRIPFRLLGW